MIIKDFRPDRKQSYLVTKDDYDQSRDNCMICMDTVTFPSRCRGCMARFCRKCISRWRQNSNTCPLKCSVEWELQEVPSTNIKLQCPFSQECNKILTPQTFDNHASQCLRAPEHIRASARQKKNYLCSKEHKLKFFIDRFVNHEELQCDECKQITICRIRCNTCKVFYCSDCRNIPLTKYICPNEHVLVYKNSSPGSVCDICRLQPFYRNRKCYEDMSCRVSICEDCYKILPTPPKHLIKWVNPSELEQNETCAESPHKISSPQKEYNAEDNQQEWQQYDPALWL